MTFRVRNGNLLQACSLPARRRDGWGLTVRLEGFSVHRGWLSHVGEAMFWLTKEESIRLRSALEQLDGDYQPQTCPSGLDCKFLTYLANSKSRHVTWIDGRSNDFERIERFNDAWTVLEGLAARIDYHAP